MKTMFNLGKNEDKDIVRFLRLQVIIVITYNSVRLEEMKALHQVNKFENKRSKKCFMSLELCLCELDLLLLLL